MLGKRGSSIKSFAMMYNEVFQAVLLYGREIWDVADTMMTLLEGFHLSITRWIAGITARKIDGG